MFSWMTVGKQVYVHVSDPAIVAVDLLVLLEEAPILRDEFDVPLDELLNGYLDEDSFGSASLYEVIQYKNVDIDLTHYFEFPSSMSNLAYKVVMIYADDRYLVSPIYEQTDPAVQVTYENAEFRFEFYDTRIRWDEPASGPYVNWDIVNLALFVALLGLFQLLIIRLFGYKTKRSLLFAGLFHLGFIVALAALNYIYHQWVTLAMLLILTSFLILFGVSQSLWFGFRLQEKSPARGVSLALFGTVYSAVLIFLQMSTW
ncbi:MAG: hypothetical protein MZU97_24025 [Bacillus subtilis]|nr:hypothetical protein [Bacillus subtilis]